MIGLIFEVIRPKYELQSCTYVTTIMYNSIGFFIGILLDDIVKLIKEESTFGNVCDAKNAQYLLYLGMVLEILLERKMIRARLPFPIYLSPFVHIFYCYWPDPFSQSSFVHNQYLFYCCSLFVQTSNL